MRELRDERLEADIGHIGHLGRSRRAEAYRRRRDDILGDVAYYGNERDRLPAAYTDQTGQGVPPEAGPYTGAEGLRYAGLYTRPQSHRAAAPPQTKPGDKRSTLSDAELERRGVARLGSYEEATVPEQYHFPHGVDWYNEPGRRRTYAAFEPYRGPPGIDGYVVVPHLPTQPPIGTDLAYDSGIDPDADDDQLTGQVMAKYTGVWQARRVDDEGVAHAEAPPTQPQADTELEGSEDAVVSESHED